MGNFRSWLFVPGDDKKKIIKARELSCDAIIYDLEDSVSDSQKSVAREQIKEAVFESEKPVFVRINDLSTSLFINDLEAVISEKLTGIVLPKVSTKEDVILLARIVEKYEDKYKLPSGQIEVIPLIESAKGVIHAYEIAQASSRILRMTFGAVDFTYDIGVDLTKGRQEILFACSQVVLASRAAGINSPVDTIFPDLYDNQGFYENSMIGKKLGFKGRLVIHPHQINVVNNLYSPSNDELNYAKQIIHAFEEGKKQNKGVIEYDGKMIDLPVVEKAWRLVKQTENIN